MTYYVIKALRFSMNGVALVLRYISLVAFFSFSAIFVSAAHQEISLYGTEKMPYSKPNELKEYEADCWGATCIYQVVNPTLTIFKPTTASNGAAVLILPGGGYQTEAIYHEGYEIAKILSSKGILAAVLKYRLPNPLSATKPELVPITDLRKALSLLREQHQELKINPNNIGVMGFSAGSHLATVASVNLSQVAEENPNFSLLIYGVTRLNNENKKWLQDSLYHRPLTSQEIAENTLLKRISPHTPPAFLVHAMDDEICHYLESTLYAQALHSKNIPVEIHLFPTGGHGFGAGNIEDGTDQWLALASNWINRLRN
ncbi:alpha/beta hydrolase [Thalassotalea crassostreae]|uniref:alpha/beta hydrolase n=1 Tax=Thalassotalea crassostreae TaxID=1763536 RepID=UPI0008386E29|nr:alpha/beta hydrolase [Thalassotalea crassostreae]